MSTLNRSIIDSDPYSSNTSQLLIVVLISLLLHSAVVLWFASRTPDFPSADFNDFKVGLIAAEGQGETLQASLSDIVAVSEVVTEVVTEESGIVTQQDSTSDIIQAQALHDIIETASPVEATTTESIELAAVIATPEINPVPDTSSLEIKSSAQAMVNEIEESQPIEAVETIIPSASSTDIDVIETVGISTEIENVMPINDFFKPAEILTAGDPIASLPIEQLSAVPAPEAIKPDNAPLLADDVEILQIKARDVVIQQKSIPAKPIPKTPALAGSGQDSLHPRQNLLASSNTEDSDQNPVEKKVEEPKPVVIPRSYVLELKNWLGQYKKYPAQAHRLKQEGVVIVGIIINRSGEIISYEIKRSSGHKALDQEVENMIKRASKMPMLPDDFPRDQLELLIPIRFKVKS